MPVTGNRHCDTTNAPAGRDGGEYRDFRAAELVMGGPGIRPLRRDLSQELIRTTGECGEPVPIGFCGQTRDPCDRPEIQQVRCRARNEVRLQSTQPEQTPATITAAPTAGPHRLRRPGAGCGHQKNPPQEPPAVVRVATAFTSACRPGPGSGRKCAKPVPCAGSCRYRERDGRSATMHIESLPLVVTDESAPVDALALRCDYHRAGELGVVGIIDDHITVILRCP